MHGDTGDDPGRIRRWEKGFEVFAIVVVVLFVGFQLSLLLFGGGGGESSSHGRGGGGNASMGGHGGSMSSAGGHGGNTSSMGGNMSTTGGHGAPGFGQSFGFIGLALSGGYLASLAMWARLRREWTFLVRHVASAAAMLLLVVLYLNAFGGFEYDIHSWNRSFANASVVLFAVTLAISPLARLWRAASHALAWRRETGIWATIAAAIHVGIFWEGALGWEWRRFFYPSSGRMGDIAETLLGDPSRGLLPTAFNVANVVGLVALVYALVLAVASNDASQRWLRSGWSWLMKRSTTMWLLVLLHAWVFAYYITFGNALAIGTLWASFWMVLLLQTAAFSKTVWLRRLGPAAAHKGSVTDT